MTASALRGWRLRQALAEGDIDGGDPTSEVIVAAPKPTKLRWPDVAPPLDLSIDYSRATATARWRERYPDARTSPRGRREDADELVPFWTAPPGYCRVCGEPTPTRRHRWHDDCVTAYNALASGQGFRNAVWERDRGVCAACPPGTPPQPRWNGSRCTGCGQVSPPGSRCWSCSPFRLRVAGHPDPPLPPLAEPIGWDADHIVPLIDGGPNTLANAQTLCLPHHRAKTAAETKARAARKRGSAS